MGIQRTGFLFQTSRVILIASLVSVACSSNTDDGPTSSAGAGGQRAGVSGANGVAGHTSASGAAGAVTGGTAGTGGMSGTILKPPNPRTDIGPPDGVLCNLQIGTASVCPAGQKCCVKFPFGDNACIPVGDNCSNPGRTVSEIGCDGPEDCPGQLCCGYNLAQGTIEFEKIACAASCQAESQSVVCRDPRDCLRTDDDCAPGSDAHIDRCL